LLTKRTGHFLSLTRCFPFFSFFFLNILLGRKVYLEEVKKIFMILFTIEILMNWWKIRKKKYGKFKLRKKRIIQRKYELNGTNILAC
jgi:hypothetical protein